MAITRTTSYDPVTGAINVAGTINVASSMPNEQYSRMFTPTSYIPSPYHLEDVTPDFIKRLQVYVDAMIAGDIEKIPREFLFAIRTVLYQSDFINRPLDEDRIQRMWQAAATENGSLPVDFAHKVQKYITKP